MLSLVSKLTRNVKFVPKKAATQKARPARPITRLVRYNPNKYLERSLFTSSILKCKALGAEQGAEDAQEAESKDLDYTTLAPKGTNDKPSIWKKQVVMTDYERQRNRLATAELTKLVLRSGNENPSTNRTLVEALAQKDYEKVKKLWDASAAWGAQPTLDGFNAVLLSLTVVQDDGCAEEFDEALRQLIVSKWKMNVTSFFILVEHYCKTQEWHYARMYFSNLIDNLEVRFELALEAYDVALETGKPVPAGVEAPFYKFYEACGFETMDALMQTLHYYALIISSNAGRAGPLTRRRTLEALTKHWSVTQVGTASPFLGIEELLKTETELVNAFHKS